MYVFYLSCRVIHNLVEVKSDVVNHQSASKDLGKTKVDFSPAYCMTNPRTLLMAMRPMTETDDKVPKTREEQPIFKYG